MNKRQIYCLIFTLSLIIPVGIIASNIPTEVEAASDPGTAPPDTWVVSLMGTGTNTTYTLDELMHMPLASANGTTSSGNYYGYWLGVRMRDLLADHDDGLWEYQVKFNTSDGNSQTKDSNIINLGDTLLAFMHNGTWLNNDTKGWFRMATLSSSSGSFWPGNITSFEVIPVNSTMTANNWDLTIDGFTDQVLDYDSIVHLPRTEVFGTLKSTLDDPGIYTGFDLKSIVREYVGPWTNYTVNLCASDGFNSTLDKATLDSKDLIIAYAKNYSQYTYADDGYLLRAFSINDTTGQAGKHSLKNLTKITITPLESSQSFNLRIKNGDSGEFLASYDALELTSMPYLEGPVDVQNDWGSDRGFSLMRGINLSMLLTDLGFNLSASYMTANTTAAHSWGVIDLRSSGPSPPLTIEQLAPSNENETGIVAYWSDGESCIPKSGIVGIGAPEARCARWNHMDTISIFYDGPATTTDTTDTTDGTTTPPPIDPQLIMLLSLGGVFAVVIVVLGVYIVKVSKK
ncbi:MAG: hypothetical protein ACTSUV_07050 [Candidatus Ranarchaeia archaeon]